ncbi:MAG: acyl-CoA dehydrogenase [Microbacteriaceae bacterium BACL25 MAG-120322-bin65]|nr:MAG: acyl-CoA dehydrogenase [Microbacteriaceae bacterium BACL25 MAG-120322-bin65]
MNVDKAANTLEHAPSESLSVDAAALGEQLLGRWADIRTRARALCERPEMWKIEGQPVAEHRQRVFDQLHHLVDAGGVLLSFPESVGGKANPGGNIANFEQLVLADPSLQIKSGVQWGLFGAAVMHLGTEDQHKKWLPGIMNLDVPGCFAMTETGHGSDVASIATTATFDESTGDFILHTPHRGAWKDYIGNAAIDGKAAVVFAQLIVGGENHGVHALYVPLRDEKGFLPGVGGDDDGPKGGLNGIDNGRLHFTSVRVPRENLLNRYGHVDEDGVYSSPIESRGRRFFTILGTLVQGRVSLVGASVVASQLASTIALRYSLERRQFPVPGTQDEQVLLDYQTHQRRLLPRLANTYAMSFAQNELLGLFHDVFSGESDTEEARQDLETLAAALKPYATWSALDIAQGAREACGGQGFLAENRLATLHADLDVYATFEGDNTVLLQLVAKRLLGDYAKQFAGADIGAMAGYLAEQVSDLAFNRSGLRRLAQNVADFGSTARSIDYVRSTDSQRQLLTDRVHTMVAAVADHLRPATKLPPHEAAELMNQHQSALVDAAWAHAELVVWEAFTNAIDAMDEGANKQLLRWLRDLHGFTLIEKHRDWYLMNGRLSVHRAEAITDYIQYRLFPRIRPHVGALVAGFGLSAANVRAPIALGQEEQRQSQAREYERGLS